MVMEKWSRKDINDQDIRDLKMMYIVLILFHLVLELLYAYIGCMPMYVINMPVLLGYFFCLRFIKRKYAALIMLIAYIETLVHFNLASFFLGMGYGFYLPLTGLLIGFWFATVKYCSDRVERLFRILYTIACCGSMIGIYLYTRWIGTDTVTVTHPSLQSTIYIINILCSFVFVVGHMSLNNIRIAEEEHYLTRKAEYDELTGLRNRIGLDHEIKKLNLACENTNEKYAVAMLDIDLFKEINDTYGHIVGDQVLRELGSIFEREVKKNIICGRWGGEEFLFITVGEENVADFEREMERLRSFIEGHLFRTGNIMIQLTVSIGIGARDGVLDRRAVEVADQMLYKAKNNGRNRVVVA